MVVVDVDVVVADGCVRKVYAGARYVVERGTTTGAGRVVGTLTVVGVVGVVGTVTVDRLVGGEVVGVVRVVSVVDE
jgi:hypothetical protein